MIGDVNAGRFPTWKQFRDWADRLDYAFAHSYDIARDGLSADLMSALADHPAAQTTWGTAPWR